MKKSLLFALTIAICSCNPSEEELKQKAEQEQKTKDSIETFETNRAIDNTIDSVRLYGKKMETFYDYKISLIKHGHFTEKELEKYTTYEQMDSVMRAITDKIVEDVKQK